MSVLNIYEPSSVTLFSEQLSITTYSVAHMAMTGTKGNLEISTMGRCTEVLCRHCTILHEGRDHLQILAPVGVSWGQLPKDTEGQLYHC